MASIINFLRLLADPTRLRLLLLLEQEELSVAELQEILGMGQSRISSHLAQLKRAGVGGRSARRKERLLRPDEQGGARSAQAQVNELTRDAGPGNAGDAARSHGAQARACANAGTRRANISINSRENLAAVIARADPGRRWRTLDRASAAADRG